MPALGGGPSGAGQTSGHPASLAQRPQPLASRGPPPSQTPLFCSLEGLQNGPLQSTLAPAHLAGLGSLRVGGPSPPQVDIQASRAAGTAPGSYTHTCSSPEAPAPVVPSACRRGLGWVIYVCPGCVGGVNWGMLCLGDEFLKQKLETSGSY